MTEPVFVVHQNPVGWNPPHYMAQVDLAYAGLPGQVEQVWLKELGDGLFRVSCVPFCVLGLALNDTVMLDSDGRRVATIRERSGHRVLRALLYPGRESELAAVRDGLSAVAHRTGAAHEHHGDRFMAFDVAPGTLSAPLEQALKAGAQAQQLQWEWGDTAPFQVSGTTRLG